MPIDTRRLDDIEVFEINDHILAFYAGRDWTRMDAQQNWLDDGAMKLGIATYAIYREEKAVIYDTFADISQAVWMRNFLEKRGIKQFTVVLSHWHPDHIAGNAVFQDSNIISNALTLKALKKHKADLEGGKAFGPPAINPVFLPNIAFSQRMEFYLDDLKLELQNLNVHSEDGTIIYLPADKFLLAGDMLEDSVTYVADPGGLVEHVNNLKRIKQMDLSTILPNHGDPLTIEAGGYDITLIDATINYIIRMVSQAHDSDYLNATLKSYVQEELDRGWIHYYEPYEEVHRENLIKILKYFKDRPLPSF